MMAVDRPSRRKTSQCHVVYSITGSTAITQCKHSNVYSDAEIVIASLDGLSLIIDYKYVFYNYSKHINLQYNCFWSMRTHFYCRRTTTVVNLSTDNTISMPTCN